MQLRLREGSVRWRPLAIAAAAVILVAAASSNAKPAAGPVGDAGNSDGVTSTSVTIGGIASQSGPIAADFSGIIDGVSAYLDMVNASGGVDGRKILYPVANQLDDAGDPSSDENAARTLVQQDHVFAIVGVGTPNFAAYSYLVPQGVPTFGYAVGPEWSRGDNLFGAEGSYIDFLSPGPEPAFLAQQVHATKVGLLAYSVTASHDACTGFGSVLHRFGIDTVFQDLAIPAPALDLSSDVIRM
ncbi:MAG TPA: ABC transporter substrate-binding protein, partial [Acidimicrobiales bacterium]|nr:ABC transporter substrate-binding protein [Acidimicrobiales bacterium]